MSMNNKKKICVYIMLMLLGVSNISANGAVAKDSQDEKPTKEVQEVKNDNAEVVVKASDNSATDESEVKVNRDTLDDAADLISKKDYNSAITLLSAYISEKPKKYEAYKLRGDSYYAMRQYKLARDDYQKAIDLKTSDDKFLTGTKVLGALVLGADKDEQYQNPELGNLYGRLMYAQKALNSSTYEASYQKAVGYNSHIYLPKPDKDEISKINCPQKYGKLLDPQGVDRYINSAVENIEKGHFSEAIYKSQYVTSNYPEFYLGYYLSGVSLAGMDKISEAINSFETAIKYNPNDFESFASLGQLYYREAEKTFDSEKSQKSIDYFKSALKLNPNCYLYYYYIGLNYLQLGEYNLAINNFNSAIKYKSNDYNSRYYKLIAQYILGDYSAVIEDTTRLLYRHVSNYNSVLYLRALAEYKQGYFDDALADIEKVHINMNDIYNADIKQLTPKEKTLESYLYYLKSQIMNKKGFGAKADYQKAVQNPIIANLAKVESTVTQYTKHLADDAVSFEDYNKYKKLYDSSIRNLLDKNLVITSEDVDNQYDYIRTTFDNLGLTFKYEAPNYKLTTIEDYANKKYGAKFASDNSSEIEANANSSDANSSSTPLLKKSTDPSETLAGDKSSIALMLASRSLVDVEDNEVSESNITDSSSDSSKIQSETQDTVQIQQNESSKTDVIAQNSEDIPVLRKETSETVNSEAKDVENVSNIISDDDKKENQNTEDSVEQKGEPIIIEAPVQKESETFEIINAQPDSKIETPDINSKESEQNIENVEPSANDNVLQDQNQTNKSIEEVPAEKSSKVEEPSIDEKMVEPVDEVKTEDASTQADKPVQDLTSKTSSEKSELKEETIEEKPVSTQKDETSSEEKVENKNIEVQNKQEEVQEVAPKQEVSTPSNEEQTLQNSEDTKVPESTNEEAKPLPVLRDRAVETPVVEKHAKVNLKNFNLDAKPQSQMPEGDEVVLYEPTNFIKEAEKRVVPSQVGFQNPNIVTDNFAVARTSSEQMPHDILDTRQVRFIRSSKVAAPSILAVENMQKPVEKVENSKLAAQTVEQNANEILNEDIQNEVENISSEAPQDQISSDIDNSAENISSSDVTSGVEEKKGNWFTSLFKKKSKDENKSEQIEVTNDENNEQVESAETNENNNDLEQENSDKETEVPEEPQTSAEKSISSIVQSTFLGETIKSEQTNENPEETSDSNNSLIETSTDVEEKSTDVSSESEVDVEKSEDLTDEVKVPWYKRIFKKKDKAKEISEQETLEESVNNAETEDVDNKSLDENIDSKENSSNSEEVEKSLSSEAAEITKPDELPVDAPQIRDDKAEIEASNIEVQNEDQNDTQVEPKKEKKKFTWWWQKDKDKTTDVEKEKSKFSFKNLFSRKKSTTTEQAETPVKEKKVIKELQKDKAE